MLNPQGTGMRARVRRVGVALMTAVGLVLVAAAAPAVAAPTQKASGGTKTATPAPPKISCDAAALQAAIDPNVSFSNDGRTTTGQITLQSAQALATAAPTSTPYCRIDGSIVTAGADVNDVKFQVSLPTRNFNGRYFQSGQGGAGGSVSLPRNNMLDEGYASASTDRGAGASTGLMFGASTGLCEGCGFHAAAIAAQRATKAFYGTPGVVRYVSGCSAGGADGRTSALNYGAEDFDAVVSGDSPQGFGLVLGFGRIAKYLAEHPDGWISADQLTKSEAAVVAKYDAADGATDGVIQDDRNFRLDDQVLRDSGLTDAQIAAVHFVNSPWKGKTKLLPGDGTFPGYPIGRMSQWNLLFGFVPPPWTTGQLTGAAGFTVVNSFLTSIDPTLDFNKMSFDQIVGAFDANREPTPGDYRDFRDDGGKMILFNGKGDGFVTYFESLQTHDELRALPGSPNVDKWMRMFLVQGMDHCSGPNGPADAEQQMINAAVDWVENGKAPDSVTGSRSASDTKPARTFLVCAEPEAARYKGKGDVNDAANWKCVSTPPTSKCAKRFWSPVERCPAQAPTRGVSFTIK